MKQQRNVTTTRLESSSLSSSNTPVEKKDKEKTETTDLRVSTNFNTEETNNKLKTSTHVIVEEDDEPSVPESTDSFERTREGPATAALEKAVKDDRDISFAKGNLEVNIRFIVERMFTVFTR
jgi:hypothetical protein